ncbi:MAG TPA: YhjD/YihY/BrkB family envelope integrity protein [Spirochaetales bacterium]|nr:YhjD/YihY/BrkB family envelope integrity protein [Spirochaetales bacterium]
MSRSPVRFFKSVSQRVVFSLEQFSRHEMANHAAAGAYAFLLSAIPAVLVILFVSSRVLGTLDSGLVLGVLDPIIAVFGGREAIASFVSTPLAGFTGAFGVVNLLWAARLFIVSMQRGMRIVYADGAKVNPVRENALTFAVEIILILAIVLIISASQVARAAIGAIHWKPMARLLGLAVSLGLHAFPTLALWLFVFLTYKNVPPVKPRAVNAAIGSAACLVTYTALGALLSLTLNTARYGLLYGILGNLIIGLIKVYFFFWLYFFFAELCHTLENFDSMLFARFHRLAMSDKPAKGLDRTLFSNPARLIRRYAREYSAGETIFEKGDDDRSALYLYRGSVEIGLPPAAGEAGAVLSTVGEGELFGEMAWLLEEPRSARAVAKTDCMVFVLPPEMFERYLAQDAGASRRLVELMAARLKANNERVGRSGER